jgi:hypothetical protein
MFRRIGDQLRTYITWGSGAGVGWEHIYSADHPWEHVRHLAHAAVTSLDAA